MAGIVSFGGYVPKRRLQRAAVFGAVGWHAPAIMMMAQGERSMCNWDEDTLTMAVAASRDCLTGADKNAVEGLYLASTSLPFADRQNAGIVAAALNLGDELTTADFTSAQKAGTTALIAALQAVAGGETKRLLVAAADQRRTKVGSFYELWFGDGGASLLVGDDDVIAEYLGSFSVSYDFVDHYREAGRLFDYTWEERWVRDEGYGKIIPEAIGGLLKKLSLQVGDVARFVYPCYFSSEHKKIARRLGMEKEQVANNLHKQLGETGTAHPLLMLAGVLEQAKPGEKIVVAGFGQGCDALCFEVTEKIADLSPRRGLSGSLADRVAEENYTKFLGFNDMLDTEEGIRAEAPNQTAMTALWRHRKELLGLVGGKCTECGTPQFPKTKVCVNPKCNAFHSQEDYEFADRGAKIKSYTGDMLSVSIEPPAIYGLVQFEGGGRMIADFTDCELHKLKVGQPVRMSFRKRYHDAQRGFTGYFWKAVPQQEGGK